MVLCVLPTPFSHHASSSISCPGFSLANRMSGCTGLIGASRKTSACSPCGIHWSCEESTCDTYGCRLGAKGCRLGELLREHVRATPPLVRAASGTSKRGHGKYGHSS